MNEDFLINLVISIMAIAYSFFFIVIAYVDGIFEALTWATLPARLLNYINHKKFWGEIDTAAIYVEVESKLVGSQDLESTYYPFELSTTFWGLFNTPEGKRELKLALIRPLWPFVSMISFMTFIFLLSYAAGFNSR